MHVALVSVNIEPESQDAALDTLRKEIVPAISSAPGFVAGYWLEPRDGKGFAVIAFESEEQARQSAPPAGSSPTQGVTVENVEFRAVAESA